MKNITSRILLLVLCLGLFGAAVDAQAQQQRPPRPPRDDAPRDRKQPPGPIIKEDKRGYDRPRGDDRPRGERPPRERRPQD